jgi:predicted LPLAT superfamily acyltransferase
VRSGVDPHDLIEAAFGLCHHNGRRPKQAHLLRAVSTAYYAMFHALARCCADTLIGGPNSERSKPAWRQVYRSLDHGPSKTACMHDKMSGFPTEIQDFANMFRSMQEKRHKADYDPQEKAFKSAVLFDLDQVKLAIARFENAPLKDRRAFAAFVLFKQPRKP